MPARNLTYRPAAVSSLFTAHSSQAEIYAFSAKERDVETGLSYFGARYYSSDLSIWLSVDPMSDKYPSLSSYVYCANNPVKLVDPNGEEVWLIGKEWELAFKQLKSATNLILERDAETGKITYSGTILTENDQKLADALDDKKVCLKLKKVDSKRDNNDTTEKTLF